jgi:hypothetical protein
MTVTLSPHAEQLVREQLARGVAQSPEEVIEQALERISQTPGSRLSAKTPAEAVAEILEIQQRNTLGGIRIGELIQEGRKY